MGFATSFSIFLSLIVMTFILTIIIKGPPSEWELGWEGGYLSFKKKVLKEEIGEKIDVEGIYFGPPSNSLSDTGVGNAKSFFT